MRSLGLVVFDRDGVLNELVARGGSGAGEAPLSVADVQLVPEADIHLRRLSDASWKLAMATNQPAAAKGECPLAVLEAVHRAVLEKLESIGILFDGHRVCWHHPEGLAGSPLSGPCGCRKPAAGMLTGLLQDLGCDPKDCWMVGDTDADVIAGRSIGARTILLTNPMSAHKRNGAVPDFVAADLGAAIDIILGSQLPK